MWYPGCEETEGPDSRPWAPLTSSRVSSKPRSSSLRRTCGSGGYHNRKALKPVRHECESCDKGTRAMREGPLCVSASSAVFAPFVLSQGISVDLRVDLRSCLVRSDSGA
ncbi:unnamed protein product [Boreogadus saida]